MFPEIPQLSENGGHRSLAVDLGDREADGVMTEALSHGINGTVDDHRAMSRGGKAVGFHLAGLELHDRLERQMPARSQQSFAVTETIASLQSTSATIATLQRTPDMADYRSTASMMVVEIAARTIFGSTALIVDGWHMSSHAAKIQIRWTEDPRALAKGPARTGIAAR